MLCTILEQTCQSFARSFRERNSPVSLARTNQNGETTGRSASRRFPSIDTNSPDRYRRYRKYSSCDHTSCKAIDHVPAATSCISDIEFLDRPGHVRTFPLIPYRG